MSRRWVLLAAAMCAAGCTSGGGGGGRPASSAHGSGSTTAVSHPRGGTARVGVWDEPNPDAPTLGGAAVRSLVLPQLYVAGPDGRWSPSLVLAGSDATAPGGRSASFRLRPGAVWSDGSPITVDDLRRSADARFVAGVDGPTAAGVITVRFTQALPGWRRLWSGVDVIRPAKPGVWGGPFVLGTYTPGLEAVLRPNDHWYGGRASLDEVHLVLVPDETVARQLLAKGELDVVMPVASTNRTPRLRAVAGVHVSVGKPGGWWVGLLLRADGLTPPRRAALVASVDRLAFVGTLLRGEATQLDGLSPVTAGAGGAWSGAGAGSSADLKGVTVDLVGLVEDPMAASLERSMQIRAHPAGARLDLRNAEADRVEGWVAAGSYQAAIVSLYDSPAVCWTCRWASVDETAARDADAGQPGAVQALERRLRDDSLVLPLWRPIPVVAWRTGLAGVAANGYALSAAWNAWEWYRPTASPSPR